MLFADLVATSSAVAATRSRTAKRAAISRLLQATESDELAATVGFLSGDPAQGRIGVGWATLSRQVTDPDRHPPTSAATLTVRQVDQALTAISTTAGPGSVARRDELLGDLFDRATAAEADFLVRLIGGELRQGALAALVGDAVADAAGVPASTVRRAAMLGGRLDQVATLAMTGGEAALAAIGLEPGRPVQPMLAATAADVAEAVAGPSSVEWKLDGIRIQVHRVGDDIRVFSRNLNDLTDRVPDVVAVVRSFDAERLVLDGEAMGFDEDGRPRLFQDTASWRDEAGAPTGLQPFFFDLLHVDGTDLIDRPLSERRERLVALAAPHVMPGRRTADVDEAAEVLAEAVAAGHEGVVVKAIDSPYEAGRRGSAWRKVKPVHTLDLVVLAAEWGHGRRTGWLSNLHLGARDPDGRFGEPGGLVMVGKTFKGMTDEVLAWQTARFLELAGGEGRGPEADDHPPTGTVVVPPALVVEIAVDGVQRSTRYPGGVALRFARVVRYREDKDPGDADRIDAVRELGAR